MAKPRVVGLDGLEVRRTEIREDGADRVADLHLLARMLGEPVPGRQSGRKAEDGYAQHEACAHDFEHRERTLALLVGTLFNSPHHCIPTV